MSPFDFILSLCLTAFGHIRKLHALFLGFLCSDEEEVDGESGPVIVDAELTAEQLLAVEILRKADALLITAGAGMSLDSGLPDFR